MINEQETIQLMIDEAEAGNPEAAKDYAVLYMDMIPEEADDDIKKRVVRYLEMCMDAGDDDSCLRLGELYLDGEFVEKDVRKAFEYLVEAADGQDQETAEHAVVYLGIANFAENDSEDASVERSYHYLMTAFLKYRNAYAALLLGDLIGEGSYTESDPELAFQFYQQARDIAEKKGETRVISEAEYRLALCCADESMDEYDVPQALYHASQAESYAYLDEDEAFMGRMVKSALSLKTKAMGEMDQADDRFS